MPELDLRPFDPDATSHRASRVPQRKGYYPCRWTVISSTHESSLYWTGHVRRYGPGGTVFETNHEFCQNFRWQGDAKLPPDPDEKNEQRAWWAADALAAFCVSTGLDITIEQSEAVSDLLCNLQHWCDRNGVDFNDRLRAAEGHYEAETDPAGPI